MALRTVIGWNFKKLFVDLAKDVPGKGFSNMTVTDTEEHFERQVLMAQEAVQLL